MAKRPKLGKSRAKGHIKKCVGKERLLNGQIRPKIFYIGKDEQAALLKAERLQLEWNRLVAGGYQTWTDEVLSKLEDDGVINKSRIRRPQASHLIGEPYEGSDLALFTDPETGLVKPESAPQLLDFGSRKVFGRLDVRSRFFEDLYTQAMKDPLSCFERCSRAFGWSAKETANFLNMNINGTVSMNPIAFDASEQPIENLSTVEGTNLSNESGSDNKREESA